MMGDGYWPQLADLQQRLQLTASEQHLALLGSWSCYRVSALHPRHFAGVALAASLQPWADTTKSSFLAAWTPLLESLRAVSGGFWQWPDMDCQRQAECLADFARQHPYCIASLPLPMQLFFARLFLLAEQTELYFHYRKCFVDRLGVEAGALAAEDLLSSMYRIAWANEQAEPDEAAAVAMHLRQRLAGQSADTLEFLDFARLYLPRTTSSYQSVGSLSEVDLNFAEALRGKRVAIVGPVDVGLASGAEIDCFDLVIRLSHRANNALVPRHFGSRTDIAYYVEDDLRCGSSENFLPVMVSLSFVVLAESCLRSFPWLEVLGERLRPRFEVGTYKRNPFLAGYPAAVQRVLMDVLRFAPAQVKVFNSDLYLSRRYGGNYFQPGEQDYSYYPGFALHDPLSNFLFMQRSWRGGWFEADSVLAGVLSLSVPDYQAAFIGVHGNLNRDDL
ncbi:hypothetical protein [Pseudomonas sp.]|uniref:hypothetical protein n=1 Tax=Pseudomonas sp. TaxID=306 RepID=UPI002D800F3D|nr:hypothetical protein [Pseudomonas sp.]